MTKSNIYFRALEPSDIDLLYKWENDKNVWRVSATTMPYSRYTLQRYIESSFIDIYESKQLRLIIMSDEKSIGSVDIFEFDPHNSHAGVGIIIFDPNDRGKGVAKEAMRLLCQYCFKTLALHQIYCNITADNCASLALFSSLGFETVGIKKDFRKIEGKFYDEIMMQKIAE